LHCSDVKNCCKYINQFLKTTSKIFFEANKCLIERIFFINMNGLQIERGCNTATSLLLKLNRPNISSTA
jgi:hypothetical protein